MNPTVERAIINTAIRAAKATLYVLSMVCMLSAGVNPSVAFVSASIVYVIINIEERK